jgi:hypothetical protein
MLYYVAEYMYSGLRGNGKAVMTYLDELHGPRLNVPLALRDTTDVVVDE